MKVKDFQAKEARFAMLARSRPEEFEELQALAQADAEERWHFYEQLAGVERHAPGHLEEHEAASGSEEVDA
jgi:pyruvate-ferredoxin/flavodoxin oxidoreductase